MGMIRRQHHSGGITGRMLQLRSFISRCVAGKVIAEALHMDYAFLCEFEELRSPLRDALSQVDPHSCHA